MFLSRLYIVTGGPGYPDHDSITGDLSYV